jgi:hypothetical protein
MLMNNKLFVSFEYPAVQRDAIVVQQARHYKFQQPYSERHRKLAIAIYFKRIFIDGCGRLFSWFRNVMQVVAKRTYHYGLSNLQPLLIATIRLCLAVSYG